MSTLSRNIYFLLQHLKIGGIEITTVNLANALVKRGYNVTFIVFLNENELVSSIDHRVKIRYLTHLKHNTSIYYKLRWRIDLRLIKKAIKSIHNSIVISSRDEFTIILSKYGNMDCTKIAQLHNEYKNNNRLIYNIINNYINIDYYVLLTNDVRDEVSILMKPKNKRTKCITIPNFNPDRNNETSTFTSNAVLDNILEHDYCIAVGRLSVVKGFDRLINIWRKISKQTSNKLKLLIIGDGEEEHHLRQLINRYNITDDVILTGAMDNSSVQFLMKGAIAYCMTSYNEAFPLVLMEAMVQSLPQIAYDVRVGPRNLIINNITGFLIPDNNEEMYSAKIIELYTNKNLREKMKMESKKRSLFYNEANIIEMWNKILI